MSSTRHRRNPPQRDAYDPATSADDPAARPDVRLLDLLLQVSLDARHSALHFSVDAMEGGRVTAEASGGPTVLLRAPADALQAFVERLKLLANFGPEHTPPAEGVIPVSHAGTPVVLRLVTTAGPEGQELVRLEFDWPIPTPETPASPRD